jgi:hypothetical protein
LRFPLTLPSPTRGEGTKQIMFFFISAILAFVILGLLVFLVLFEPG